MKINDNNNNYINNYYTLTIIQYNNTSIFKAV